MLSKHFFSVCSYEKSKLTLCMYLLCVFRLRQPISYCLCIFMFLFFPSGSQCLCFIHIPLSSTPIPLQTPRLKMLFAWPLVLLCGRKREVEFHHLIRADVDLISLFHSGVDKLRGDIIYSLGCNLLFNHSRSQPG